MPKTKALLRQLEPRNDLRSGTKQFYAVLAAVASGLRRFMLPCVAHPKEILRVRLQHLLSDPAILGH
jgi:hypothetical protein